MLDTKSETDELDSLFESKPANEWLRTARSVPIPRSLFGEFWMERELAVLFGDTGMGKSVLATQIGESISRGRAMAPMRKASEPQPVVYIDFEMNAKQFEMRYSEDHKGGRARFLHNHYTFSDNFHRVQIDAAEFAGLDSEATAKRLRRGIERLVRKTGSRVFIIDNLTCLKRSFYGSSELVPIMRVLKRLRRELGLSILVIAHAPQRNGTQPLSVDALQTNKMIASHADNVFAIGQSRLDTGGRYIKHMSARSSTVLCDASHVPVFDLRKIGGNFLGFDYKFYAPEAEMLNDIRTELEWNLIEKIKQMADEGLSLRTIAGQLDTPKTRVHRLLKMWRPPVEEITEGADEAAAETLFAEDAAEPVDVHRYQPSGETASSSPFDHWQPPKEAYRGEFTDRYLISIGQRPVWKEKLISEHERRRETDDGSQSMISPSAANPSAGSPHARRPALPPGLRRSLDGYDREIFIEQQDPLGRPTIWYQYDGNTLKRMERQGFAIVVSRVESD